MMEYVWTPKTVTLVFFIQIGIFYLQYVEDYYSHSLNVNLKWEVTTLNTSSLNGGLGARIRIISQKQTASKSLTSLSLCSKKLFWTSTLFNGNRVYSSSKDCSNVDSALDASCIITKAAIKFSFFTCRSIKMWD